jgi:hypothetical protein
MCRVVQNHAMTLKSSVCFVLFVAKASTALAQDSPSEPENFTAFIG